MDIDISLSYAAKYDGKWWWDGYPVLSSCIESQARHLREEGTSAYTALELDELKTLERYFGYLAADEYSPAVDGNEVWLHAEAFWLLQKWWLRFWD